MKLINIINIQSEKNYKLLMLVCFSIMLVFTTFQCSHYFGYYLNYQKDVDLYITQFHDPFSYFSIISRESIKLRTLYFILFLYEIFISIYILGAIIVLSFQKNMPRHKLLNLFLNTLVFVLIPFVAYQLMPYTQAIWEAVGDIYTSGGGFLFLVATLAVIVLPIAHLMNKDK